MKNGILDKKSNLGDLKLRETMKALSKKGLRLPFSVKEIPSFPYDSYEELKSAIEKREILLQRFQKKQLPSAIELLPNKKERFLMLGYQFATIFIPIFAFVGAFFFSAWWLFALFIFPFALLGYIKAYRAMLLRASCESEEAFCFLYFFKQVCLTSPDFSHSYFYPPKDNYEDCEIEKRARGESDLFGANRKKIKDQLMMQEDAHQSFVLIEKFASILHKELVGIIPVVDIPALGLKKEQVQKGWISSCVVYSFILYSLSEYKRDINFYKSEKYKVLLAYCLKFASKLEEELILEESPGVAVSKERVERIVILKIKKGQDAGQKFVKAITLKSPNPDASLIDFLMGEIGLERGASDSEIGAKLKMHLEFFTKEVFRTAA